MEITQLESGLVVPTQPEEPKRCYGALELKDEERREDCLKALRMLREVMGLHNDNAIMADHKVQKDRMRLYNFLAETLLGEDAPDFEILC